MSLGVIIGALVLTSGLLEGRYVIYMRAGEAEGLTRDTRVVLQGLEIGRVTEVNPKLDSATSTLGFVATLSIRERFPDGTRLGLPAEIKAEIAPPPTLVGPTVIQLTMPPPTPGQADLQPGDTIGSQRRASVVDALSQIASEMRGDLVAALAETRQLVSRTTKTVDATGSLLASARPQLEAVLERLTESLERTDRILAQVEPRVGPIADSLVATLVLTRDVLAQLDSLATTAYGMASENREAINETIANLSRSAVILENLADKISRRPLRILTGVTPPPDTAKQPE